MCIRDSYEEPGTAGRSNASWIRLGQSIVEIPPGSRISVPYRIQVPDDAGLVGTYWSMVMAEMLGSIDEAEPSESSGKDENTICLLYTSRILGTLHNDRPLIELA